MKSSIVHRRYARTLFQIARENNELSDIHDAAVLLHDSLSKSESVLVALRNPLISQKQKNNAFEKAYPTMPQQLARFIRFLSSRRRIALLPGILEEFLILVDQFEENHRATIWSATTLEEQERERLKRYLETLQGGRFLIDYLIDPRLIGGFRIQTKEQIIDCSIQHQLDQLKQRLSA